MIGTQAGSQSKPLQGRTRRYYALIALLLLIVLLQSTLLPRIRLLGASPDLVLVAVVSWSLLRGISAGLIWGFWAGLGLDLVAGMPLGASSIALMAVCFLTQIGAHSVFAGNLVLPVATVAAATACHGWLVLLIRQIGGLQVNWITTTVEVIAPAMLLNGLLLLAVYPGMRWLTDRMGISRMNW